MNLYEFVFLPYLLLAMASRSSHHALAILFADPLLYLFGLCLFGDISIRLLLPEHSVLHNFLILGDIIHCPSLLSKGAET